MTTEETMRSQIREVLEKMALGSPADSVHLLLHGEELTRRRIGNLNLMPVAGIKRSKDGITEIKYFDRLKALQCLMAFEDSSSGRESAFLNALLKTAEQTEEE